MVQFQLHLTKKKNVDFTILTFPLLKTKLGIFLARPLCPLCVIPLCCKALGKTRCCLIFEEKGCSILAGKEFLLYLLALLCKLSLTVKKALIEFRIEIDFTFTGLRKFKIFVEKFMDIKSM